MSVQLLSSDMQLASQCLQDHFSFEELSASGVLQRPWAPALRRELAAVSFRFFKQYYLADYFSVPDGPMHLALVRELETIVNSQVGIKEAIAWPRGTGKTTTCDLALPLWAILTEKLHYIILIASSLDQSKEHLRAIKDELEANPKILEDFGPVRGPQWEADDIITSTDIKMTVLGARMRIRGRKYKRWRPQLIICDDLEDDVSVRSDVQRLYLREWMMKAVLKARAWFGRRTSFVYIGTMLHFDCLLAHLLVHPGYKGLRYGAVVHYAEREGLWQEWEKLYIDLQNPRRHEDARAYFDARRDAMLEGVVLTWEGFGYYELMVEKVEGGRAAFATELQNDPADPSTRFFSHVEFFRRELRASEVWLQPIQRDDTTGEILPKGIGVPLSDCRLFGALDPSLGQSVTGDPSAIIVSAKAPTGQLFTLVADIQVRHPDVMMKTTCDWIERYPSIAKFGVESVSFQLLIKMGIEDELRRRGVYVPIEALKGLKAKSARIESLQPDIENGGIMFELGQTTIEQQILEWPMGAHDDGPDALEMARMIARRAVLAQPTVIALGDAFKFGTLLQPAPQEPEEEGQLFGTLVRGRR